MNERKKRIIIYIAVIVLILALLVSCITNCRKSNETNSDDKTGSSEHYIESLETAADNKEESKPVASNKVDKESSKVTEESSKVEEAVEDSTIVEANAEDTHVEDSKPEQGTSNNSQGSNQNTNNKSESSKPTQSTPNTNDSKPSGNGSSNNSGSNSSKPTQSESKPAQEAKPTPHVHNWVEASSKAATCTSEGSISYKCTGCSETKSETTAKASHNWVHHHEDEVNHEVTYLVCHCGWRCNEAEALAAGYSSMAKYFKMFHVESALKENNTVEELNKHSYFWDYELVIDSPAVDYDVCSVCGATK